MSIVGRESECRKVDAILAAARGVRALRWVSGGGRMSKTTLLEYALHSASDTETVLIAGAQSESEFASVRCTGFSFRSCIPSAGCRLASA